MKIHVHDNNHVPLEQNCLSEVELEAGKVLTLHLHRGGCNPRAKGHCHDGSVNLLIVGGAMYVVLEGVWPPSLITLEEMEMHVPIAHLTNAEAPVILSEPRQREQWENTLLVRGRVLTPVEQERLIVAIDRFMESPAVNSARHSAELIDDLACEIEQVLTDAGWYEDVEIEKGGDDHAKS